MTRKASFSMIGAFVLLGAGSALAQGPDPLTVGNRLRVTLGSQHRVEGRLLAADDQSLTLLAGDQPLKVPRTEIEAVDVGVARRSAWRMGAAIGAVAGVALGFGVPVDASCPGILDTTRPACQDAFHSRGEAVAVLTAGDALVGALVGHFIKHDVWAPMHLDHVRVGLMPKRQGGAMQVSLVF